jgi:hypothetical protein
MSGFELIFEIASMGVLSLTIELALDMIGLGQFKYLVKPLTFAATALVVANAYASLIDVILTMFMLK